MGMPAEPLYWTADMVRALPGDGKRYETVHGELLVSPSPRVWHQEIVGRLYVLLSDYTRRARVGHCFSGPADISWGPDNLVVPDILVADLAQARTLDWSQVQDLRLVVEVLSPSTARHDRFAKRRLYQDNRVALYWIVDADNRTVESWRPDQQFPELTSGQVTWHPAVSSAPLVIVLGELFAPI